MLSNCIDRLQPMDLSVNKPAKEFMRGKFNNWYAGEVQKQLDAGGSTCIDLKMSTTKPVGARWLVSLFDYIKNNNTVITNGFKDMCNYNSYLAFNKCSDHEPVELNKVMSHYD